MAATSITNVNAKAACDAIVDSVDAGSGAGKVRIYSGSVPTDADTALGAQVLLADLAMSDPAFGAAADATPGGRATASTITDDSSADASGTASFFRVLDSDDNVRWQGDVSTVSAGTGDMQMNSTAISSGAQVSISSFTFTVPES